ncbi:hypothetical protein AK812_SmicGene38940 [Symbiodinium microadriaticum]|uniref:Uncharacterized protein n=1 Tax=Symbiodinium microadriaticum TaxID=2951 RepID=A0A1Q9CCG8_SYMMI|nr:hypothetical protein AK812_SmicGene38940 [Symbiodinium microadriaticum]
MDPDVRSRKQKVGLRDGSWPPVTGNFRAGRRGLARDNPPAQTSLVVLGTPTGHVCLEALEGGAGKHACCLREPVEAQDLMQEASWQACPARRILLEGTRPPLANDAGWVRLLDVRSAARRRWLAWYKWHGLGKLALKDVRPGAAFALRLRRAAVHLIVTAVAGVAAACRELVLKEDAWAKQLIQVGLCHPAAQDAPQLNAQRAKHAWDDARLARRISGLAVSSDLRAANRGMVGRVYLSQMGPGWVAYPTLAAVHTYDPTWSIYPRLFFAACNCCARSGGSALFRRIGEVEHTFLGAWSPPHRLLSAATSLRVERM